VTRYQRLRRNTFASLANPNYRLYFGGQAVSLIGTWMQTIAQSYLVFTLTHSAADVGYVVALQTIPVLILGPYGGVVADRVDKRKLMVGLQSMMGVLALTLGVLTITGVVTVWMIGALAFLLGLNNTFENPARQAFVLEMVGPEHLRNAVTLNSVLVNAARAIGPAFAGILIAVAGSGVCFIVNGVSFIAVVSSLMRMDLGTLSPSEPMVRARGQLMEGLRYVKGEVSLAVPLVMMAIVGCLAYEFSVSLPVMASRAFHGGSETYGFITAAMGVGAVVGGLWAAGHGKTGLMPMVRTSAIFAVAIATAAVAPDLWLELVALAAVGAASVTFLSKGNTTLQLGAAPQMRGRVMSLWSVAFLGSTPIGGPVVGLVAQHAGPRWGLGLGAVACAVAALLGLSVIRRVRRTAVVESEPPVGASGGGADDLAAEPTLRETAEAAR
jgi:MFS family permease